MKLDPEGMYSFHYRPVGVGKINQFDRNPLIFILNIDKGLLLGLNIHWIPKIHRAEFISQVNEIMGKTKVVGKKRERQRLLYILLKKPKFKNGMEAVRKYYISHMSAIQEVPRVKWDSVLGIKRFEADIRNKSNGYYKEKK